MAVSDAVRRSGSLLLRALAVGGLATAAWLVCAGVASADQKSHLDEIATALDAVNVALGEQHPGFAGLLADVLPVPASPGGPATSGGPAASGGPATSGKVPHQSFESSVFEVAVGPLERPLTSAPAPVQAVYPPEIGDYPYPDDDPYSDQYSDPYSGDVGYSHSGYSYSGYSHSGTTSNTMPAPLYEAKVAAKAAARAAAEVALAQAQAPVPATTAPVRATAPTRVGVLPLAPVPPAAPDSQTTSNAEVIWEAPLPTAPAPAPKQAPAPSAPTASSSSSADSGGGHRGGVIASFTNQSDPKPLTAWSVERRDDGRSPGSVPGLPSTSPD